MLRVVRASEGLILNDPARKRFSTKIDPAKVWSLNYRLLMSVITSVASAIAELGLETKELFVLAEIDEFLHWKQNSNYSDAVMGEGYMDNYAYAELIGPSGFFKGEDFLLGLMLLGPRRLYPDHHHPAPELYWLLTGPSEWRRGGGEYTMRGAGETIWHLPMMSHATRTLDHPLLTVWAWTRDVSVPAKLLDQA